MKNYTSVFQFIAHNIYGFSRIIVYAIVILLLVSSCKETDDILPIIIIDSPTDGQAFSAMDTVFVSGTISDNIAIESYSINLLDEDNKPVCNPVSDQVNSKSLSLAREFPIDNIYLESGYYTIEVSANDGVNTKNEYISVNISSIPLERIAIYIVSENQSLTEVYELKESGQINLCFSVTNSYLDASVDSYNSRVNLLTEAGDLSVFDCLTNEQQWTLSDLGDGIHSYEGSVECIDNLLFVSHADGVIRGYENDGYHRRSVTISDETFHPVSFFKHESYMIVEERANTNVPNRIEKASYISGLPISSLISDFDVVSFFSLNSEKILIWGNENNQARACSLSVEYNVLTDVRDFPAGELNSVVQVDDYKFVISIGDRTYIYDVQIDNLHDYRDVSVDAMCFDNLNNQLFIAQGSDIEVVNWSTGETSGLFSHHSPIKEILILYNK